MQETTKILTRTEIAEQYLAHHGVKGQRWGVRRYQNTDGSLTSAGKKRRGVGDKDGEKSENKESKFKSYMSRTRAGVVANAIANKQNPAKALHDANKEARERAAERLKAKRDAKEAEKIAKKTGIPADETPEQREARKQAALKSGSANDILQFRGQLTNQELQGAVFRLQNESQLTNMNAQTIKTGQQRVESALSKVKTGISVITTLKDGYNVAATIANSCGANWPVLDGGKTNAARKLSREVNEMRKQGFAETSQNLGKYSIDAIKTMSQLAGYETKIRDAAGGVRVENEDD